MGRGELGREETGKAEGRMSRLAVESGRFVENSNIFQREVEAWVRVNGVMAK